MFPTHITNCSEKKALKNLLLHVQCSNTLDSLGLRWRYDFIVYGDWHRAISAAILNWLHLCFIKWYYVLLLDKRFHASGVVV